MHWVKGEGRAFLDRLLQIKAQPPRVAHGEGLPEVGEDFTFLESVAPSFQSMENLLGDDKGTGNPEPMMNIWIRRREVSLLEGLLHQPLAIKPLSICSWMISRQKVR